MDSLITAAARALIQGIPSRYVGFEASKHKP